MGDKVFAEEEPNGINRTIEENLVDKLETTIENTVVCGSSGMSIDPPYCTHHCECELRPFVE